MNGVDVTDVTSNVTADDWDQLRAGDGHTYVYQRREYLIGNADHSGREYWGGRGNIRSGYGGGRGGRSTAAGEDRVFDATNVTDSHC
jgi:hypothetical protein